VIETRSMQCNTTHYMLSHTGVDTLTMTSNMNAANRKNTLYMQNRERCDDRGRLLWSVE
jgi:hypothetical protein